MDPSGAFKAIEQVLSVRLSVFEQGTRQRLGTKKSTLRTADDQPLTSEVLTMVAGDAVDRVTLWHVVTSSER